MKPIMASELVKKINEAIGLHGDAPIQSTDYAPKINQILPASFEDGTKCFFFVNEPECEG